MRVRLAVPVDDADHVLGPRDARVTIVQYGDYQSEASVRAWPRVRDLLRRHGPGVRLVHRHFPPPGAGFAAEAVEAAGEQGAYWAMHDYLLAHRAAREEAHVLAAAATLGLDVARLARDLEERTFRARVESQRRGGLASGVAEAPAFFVDGAPCEARALERSLVRALDARPA